jgi:hypothetical protein
MNVRDGDGAEPPPVQLDGPGPRQEGPGVAPIFPAGFHSGPGTKPRSRLPPSPGLTSCEVSAATHEQGR